MRGAERVVHVVVRQAGKLLGELVVVGFFFGMEAQILQQQGLALLQLAGHLLGFRADAVGAEATFSPRASSLSSSMRRRSATGLRLIFGLGLPLGRPRWEARISRAP